MLKFELNDSESIFSRVSPEMMLQRQRWGPTSPRWRPFTFSHPRVPQLLNQIVRPQTSNPNDVTFVHQNLFDNEHLMTIFNMAAESNQENLLLSLDTRDKVVKSIYNSQIENILGN